MRIILSLLMITFFASCTTTSFIKIPANQSVDIATDDYKYSKVKLRNRSMKGVDVKVVDKKSGEFIRGFGLEPVGNAHVTVEDFGQLQLVNTTNQMLKIGYTVTENYKTNKPILKLKAPVAEKSIVATSRKSVDFKLTNKSDKSIPLKIPSVMNPNLSPFSSSGVQLKMGQKIFFKNNGKKYLLLEVDDSIENGLEIEVSELLKKRKKEFGI